MRNNLARCCHNFTFLLRALSGVAPSLLLTDVGDWIELEIEFFPDIVT